MIDADSVIVENLKKALRLGPLNAHVLATRVGRSQTYVGKVCRSLPEVFEVERAGTSRGPSIWKLRSTDERNE